jgi:ADP-ribose pyrophosphatase YjhB (NUDIX family)
MMSARYRIAVSAVAFDHRGRVLLVQQGKKRRGQWELPGGRVKKHEPILRALVREVREETGLTVLPEQLIGVFDIPDERFCDLVFHCQLRAKPRRPVPRPPEIAAAAMFAPTDLPKPIRPFTVARVRDAQRREIHALPIVLRLEQWLGR